MELSAKQIAKNWNTFRHLINEQFPSRRDNLNRLYDAMEEDERVQMAPASSYEFFHNAFPGGYVEHVLRVHEFALEQYELWFKMGMKVDNFTLEELQFAALHHDLGKLGLPGLGNEHYIYNDSKWHRDNQGKVFKSNPNIPWMNTADTTFYLLNHFQVPFSLNEMLGIKLTDGMFDEANKPYFSGFNLDSKLRVSLPYILHHADIMAYRFEFERWAKSTDKFKFENEPKGQMKIQPINNPVTDKVDPLTEFEKFFNGK